MSNVTVRDDDRGVRWVTFDRPDKLNALLLADLVAVACGLTDDPPRGVVFIGAGARAFTAGLDTSSFDGIDRAGAHRYITSLRDAMQVIRTAPVPTVAAVHGYCYGIGFELALCCDLRIATPGARCAMPEITMGFPSVIDTAMLHHHLGLSVAKAMVLTGRPFDVEALRPTGVFNQVVDLNVLQLEADRTIGELVELDRDAYASQKRLIQGWLDCSYTEVVDRSIDEFADRF